MRKAEQCIKQEYTDICKLTEEEESDHHQSQSLITLGIRGKLCDQGTANYQHWFYVDGKYFKTKISDMIHNLR